MPNRDVLAAGAVVLRPGKQVLLVHRPKYDDWSFPKGKLDPGEHPTTAAAREVAEETGLRVRLGVPLAGQRYAVAAGTKRVFYWLARVVDDDDVTGYAVNDEIDEVAWLPYDEALVRLTYERDRQTLVDAMPLRRRTHAVLVLRHGQARPRKSWAGDDRRRPLAPEGIEQARALVPVLASYGVDRVVTSSSTRCVDTVRPYAAALERCAEALDALSEEVATAAGVAPVVSALVEGRPDAVLCGHRPMLPLVFDALGLSDPSLAPGELLVAHVRRGVVVATERHLPC